jgi:hypothetical protein
MTRRYSHVLLVLVSLLVCGLHGGSALRGQAGGCAPGINPIVCENFLAGAPASEWDVQGSGDPSIQGFATTMSVNQGETVRFKVKTTAAAYRLDIYRMGYYDGMGARKVATVAPSAALPQTQPTCLTVPATGLVDCGNWAESASWLVPAAATSGIYFARLVRTDTGGASHIMFVVRDDDGESDMLFQTSDTTWQAYNSYGGNSLYTGSPAGRAYKVSYNRPLIGRDVVDGPRESSPFNAEYPMVRWLEANGYDVSYTSGIDSDRRPAELLEHKVFLSVGHDEYWSGAQRANVEAARAAGVHLAFFSGNEVFWKTRWESDGSGAPYRTLVCYKETQADAKIDPAAAWTGTWRDPRFSPPADGGRPENALTGTMFMVNGSRNDSITVREPEGKLRFWRNTTMATLAPGQSAVLPAGTLGYEWNEELDNGFRPAGLMRLSSTTITTAAQYLLNYGSQYGAGSPTHHLTLYRHSSGALVFGAGTVQWSWGLDANHDRPGTPTDIRMQQATVNLFADMTVQPGTLRSGLTAATASSDVLKPTSTITSVSQGATLVAGSTATITGTASDAGGGAVAGVEISVDGGLTWRAATGTSSWAYLWTPAATSTTTRQATIMSRAADDSGNVETPGAGVTVSVAPVGGLVAAYGFNEGAGTQVGDMSGLGNLGTISGASWAEGRFGQALTFDGVNDWVTINDANSLDLTTGMTIEAWVNPVSLSGWQSAILKQATQSLAYGLYVNDDLPRPAVTIGVGNDVNTPGVSPLALNTWTHLAGTFDGTTARLYVNGVLIRSNPAAGTLPVSTAPLRIGGNSLWGEFVHGRIDEVRIYNRALSREEIQFDMNTAVGGTPLPDTTAPAVSVSSPASGAIVSATVTVAATASDNVGISGVQFLLDGAPLGAEDVTSPYSTSWTTTAVADGSHTLSARARDAAGNLGTAANVVVTVTNVPDSIAPSVSVAAPAPGATLSGSATITANASDNVAVAGVSFFVDGAQVGAEDLAAPYSAAWNTTAVANGTHTITARARDGAGNVQTSSPVVVSVSNTAPTSLVAAYSFDEGIGTTAGDSSGRGNNGTTSGTTWAATGRFGKALSFNGTNSWVTVADASSLDLTNGMTLEAWVNPTALSGWRQVILKETPGGLAYSLYAHDNAPHPAATISISGADRSALGSVAVPLNAWTHLAATYDGAALRIFVNGVQAQSTAVTGLMVTSTGPLRIGGNAAWGEYFTGLIDEVRMHNRALTAAEIQAEMMAPVGGSGPSDTTAPSVSVTSPAAGSVAGTLTLTANATDAVGVASVEFRVDGASLGAPDTSAPYQAYWNTGALANGSSHTVTAVARDAAGNMATASPVTVTIANPTDAASIGAWSAPFDLGLVAVNMVLLHTGKVLMYPGWERGGTQASVFDPATGSMTLTPISTSNIFCTGHAPLADGRIFVVGGWDGPNGILGLQHANLFNPATLQWTRRADMAQRRWYPSATTLPDGRVLVTSGATTCDACIADVPEVYNPVNNTWTQLTGARLSIPYYPLTFVLPNGKVLVTGSTDTAGPVRTLDVATQTWSVVDPAIFDGSSAAMFLPGKVLQSGTASDFIVKPAATTTAVLDMTQASPAWRRTAPMAYPRAYNNLTILADGSVLAVGGGTNTSGIDITTSVLQAERWSPATETWTTMASGALGRLYHSTSLLMPDGRVLVAGGGDYSTAVNQTQAEYYSPPYLFKGARPTVTSAPGLIEYGTPFFVATPDAASIASVALIRTGAATHAFDENQRYVPLTFAPAAGGLTLQAPANANLAPPGHYMLFIVNTAGVPSIAPMVRLPAPYEDAVAPSAPTSLVATGTIGSIALTWSASTDNTGVTGYNVHRSTIAGFAPSPANRIAQPLGTAYTDASLAPGTYYYLVTAQDAAGNLSAPSNQASASATSDTAMPAVSLTSPAAGSTLSGTITVAANASDDVGVAGVQFLLNGAALGVEDTSAPYSVLWDTRASGNGAYTLSARARDGAGNVATTTGTPVTVSNVAAPPPSDLIASFSFDEGTGATAADATGLGHAGAISGAAWTAAGKNGGALSFDGVDDWVTVNDAADLDLTTGMTLEAWVKPNALSGWNTIVMKEHGVDTLAYGLYANDSAPWPAVTIRVGVLDHSAVGNGALPLGQWTHLAATYDGATIRLFMNGVQVGSRARTGGMVVSARALRIGGNGVWGEYFNGLIDDVRIYKRALTEAEILADMNTPVR